MRQPIFSPWGAQITATGLARVGRPRMYNGAYAANTQFAPVTRYPFHRGARLRGLGEGEGDGTNWVELLKQAQVAYNTQRIFELNADRAAQGLPLIPAQSLAPTLNLGVDTSTQRTLLLVAAGIALALLLRGKRG